MNIATHTVEARMSPSVSRTARSTRSRVPHGTVLALARLIRVDVEKQSDREV